MSEAIATFPCQKCGARHKVFLVRTAVLGIEAEKQEQGRSAKKAPRPQNLSAGVPAQAPGEVKTKRAKKKWGRTVWAN